MSQKQISIVVAACNNRGIGFEGKLPWDLSGDMKFFKKLTTETEDSSKQNAVIMGRKTFFSIPEKYRPLKHRINIVLSREMSEAPKGTLLAKNFQDALDQTKKAPLHDQVENVYVIGGNSVYQDAFDKCDRIYMTRVLADFKCDTFFPEFDKSHFKLFDDPEVDGTEKVEDGVAYRFEVYKKISRVCEFAPPPYFNIVVGIEKNRGIALNGKIPWPRLSADYEHYITLSSHVSVPGRHCVIIKGRTTWEDTSLEERENSNIRTIVISNSLKESSPHLECVVRSFDEALEYCKTREPFSSLVESIWILGGQAVYKEAIEHPLCKKIFLTRIFGEFECDRFLMEFENTGKFRQIQDKYIRKDIIEENGIPYQFEVYEKV